MPWTTRAPALGRIPLRRPRLLPPEERPKTRRYLAAVAAFVAALVLRERLAGVVGDVVPFLFFFPAIIAASWYGGAGAGLACTALSAAAVWISDITGGSVEPASGEAARLAIFATIGVFISLLNQMLHRSARSLRAALKRTSEILESVSDAFYMLDHDGRFRYVNRAAEEIWRRRREDLIGRRLVDEFPEIEGSEAFEALLKAQRERRPTQFETISPVTDGWIEADVRPVEDGVTVYFRDISDRKKLQRDLESRVERRTARLQEVNAELETFTYSASHDLRAPVRKILGYCDLIEEKALDGLSPEGRVYFKRVRSSAEQAYRLLDEILALANAVQKELKREVVDVTALAVRLLGERRAAEPGRDVRVEVADGLRADADPQLLRAALGALIDNAWKFTSGREKASIRVGASPTPGGPAFFVADDGAGFEMAHAGKLFKAFERLHETDEFPGSGVGLAIAQRVIRRHGGEIWADSRPGAGATFYFTLPR